MMSELCDCRNAAHDCRMADNCRVTARFHATVTVSCAELDAIKAYAERLRALTQQQADQIADKNAAISDWVQRYAEKCNDMRDVVEYAKGLRKSAQKALNLIPANDGAGGLIYDHHSPDGEYVGTEQVDPMCVINGMDETLNAALAKPMPKAMKGG